MAEDMTATIEAMQAELARLQAENAGLRSENATLRESDARHARTEAEATAGLTEALEQQTATSDILRAIAGSPTDSQPVLDAVIMNAARLTDSHTAELGLRDGDVIRHVAVFGPNREHRLKALVDLTEHRPG